MQRVKKGHFRKRKLKKKCVYIYIYMCVCIYISREDSRTWLNAGTL